MLEGPLGDGDWLGQVKPEIEHRMAMAKEGQFEFAIMGLVKDPLLYHLDALSKNVNHIQVVSAHLDKIDPQWREIQAEELQGDNLLLGSDAGFGLDNHMIDQRAVENEVQRRLDTDPVQDLVAYLQELFHLQLDLKFRIKEEQEAAISDEQMAADRRHDYGPAVRAWISFHARRGLVKELLITK
jgi:ubiquitin carboxyl-terminal hydrolase L5